MLNAYQLITEFLFWYNYNLQRKDEIKIESNRLIFAMIFINEIIRMAGKADI